MPLSPRQAAKLVEQILDEPAVDPPAPPAEAHPPLPERIGRFTITRLIAAGGMGLVYEARQDNPRRTVAVKVMSRHFAARGEAALRRFEYEAQILARLDHPGIARIYDAGTWDDGAGAVPYFVMEFIPRAETIIDHCRLHELTRRQRLELFAGVCDAVQHGHQKGIIHRDLKPANILVSGSDDDDGRGDGVEAAAIKVIDFGVARAADTDISVTTMHTAPGDIIGTLQYMSPEQCEGDPHAIDVRSDVYSLGVILYELLCDRLPYDVANTPIPQATRIVQEHEPQRPANIVAALRGDIEAVLLKALEKSPDDRYQTAAELADDIRRFLRGDAVEAQPPSPWARLSRWIGRHPVVSTSAAGVLIIVASITISLTTIWVLLRRPHAVLLSHDGREARLVTLGGSLLDSWHTEYEHGLSFGRLVDVPSEWGGGSLAIIGAAAPDTEFPGELCGYTTQGRDAPPAWHDRIAPGEVIRGLVDAGMASEGFAVNHVAVAEIFGGNPGQEIIAVFNHSPSSGACVRIYNLRGEVLYEVWHDGTISQILWVDAWKLMLVRGWNCEAPWSARGYPGTQPNQYPHVVFALAPELGYRGNRCISPTNAGRLEGVHWYRCIMPPDIIQTYDVRLRPPDNEHPDDAVQVNLILRDNPQGQVAWLIDRNGREIDASRGADDLHHLHVGAPHVDRGHLDELPPVVVRTP